MNKILLVPIFMLMSIVAFAQELNCRVSVNADNMSGEYASQVNKSIFNNLQQGLASFLNERRWTDYTFEVQEKIECCIQLVIEQAVSPTQFTGKIYVQLSRPVFNSTYSTPIFSYQDNHLSFKYSDNQTFDYDESSYLWTITSLAAYYAYLMLGITFDTYADHGGDAYYAKAMNIISTVPNGEDGWSTSSKDSRNRYWVLDSYYNNPQSSAFRTAMYKYHRQGLDLMAQDLENGYQGVLGSLDMLKNIYTKSTNMYCMILFGMTKCNEIVNMFLAASDEQRAHALDVMTMIDPSNTTKYDKLRK